jgi:hypothetical protein
MICGMAAEAAGVPMPRPGQKHRAGRKRDRFSERVVHEITRRLVAHGDSIKHQRPAIRWTYIPPERLLDQCSRFFMLRLCQHRASFFFASSSYNFPQHLRCLMQPHVKDGDAVVARGYVVKAPLIDP